MKRLIRGVIAAVAVGMVTACGGGGGGGGPDIEDELGAPESSPSTPTANFDATNYSDHANSLVPIVLGGVAGAQGLESGFALGASQGGTSVENVVQRIVTQVVNAHQRERAQKVDDWTEGCDSGSLDITFEYESDQTISVGDKLTVISNGCINGGVALSGAFSGQFTRYATDVDFSLRLAFVNFSDGMATLRGWADANYSYPSVVIKYLGLTGTLSGRSSQWFHTVTTNMSGNSVSSEGYVKVNGTAYFLTQVSDYHLSPVTGYPYTGALRIFDIHGESILVEAVDDHFIYSFYQQGNHVTPVAGPVSVPFTEL